MFYFNIYKSLYQAQTCISTLGTSCLAWPIRYNEIQKTQDNDSITKQIWLIKPQFVTNWNKNLCSNIVMPCKKHDWRLHKTLFSWILVFHKPLFYYCLIPKQHHPTKTLRWLLSASALPENDKMFINQVTNNEKDQKFCFPLKPRKEVEVTQTTQTFTRQKLDTP